MIVLYDCHNRVVVVVVVVLMQMLVKDGLLCECCDSDYVCNSVMLCRLMLYCSCCSCCCVTDSVSGGDDTFYWELWGGNPSARSVRFCSSAQEPAWVIYRCQCVCGHRCWIWPGRCRCSRPWAETEGTHPRYNSQHWSRRAAEHFELDWRGRLAVAETAPVSSDIFVFAWPCLWSFHLVNIFIVIPLFLSCITCRFQLYYFFVLGYRLLVIFYIDHLCFVDYLTTYCSNLLEVCCYYMLIVRIILYHDNL